MGAAVRDGPVAAVVLAAGEASRFGSPKQDLLLPAVLERAAAAALDDTVVVEGAHQIAAPLGTTVRLVRCPAWRSGPGASLRCGLDALDADVEAAIVLLADGPRLDPRAIERVISSWRESGAPVLAASYDGARSHPVLLERSTWPEVPAAGARALDARLVDCSDLTPPGDVDTPDDMARFEKDPAT